MQIMYKDVLKYSILGILYHIMRLFRMHVDYFHPERFSHDIPLYAYPYLPGILGNKCYGNIHAIKNATGKNFHKHCMIEHGLYFAEYVLKDECIMTCIDTIYTYSNYRKNAILKEFGKNFDKEIIMVGPYIQYADYFKSKDKLKALKSQLGKILLVFPTHSFEDCDDLYDFNQFSQCIDEMAKDYDTVLISMIGYDIQQGFDKKYRNKGYRIVSSGTRNDPYFLNRQRDLMELADMTISNNIGTHIGYSICLGTPHYIFNQDITSIKKAASAQASDHLQAIRDREYAEIKAVFNSREPIITPEQIAVVKKYWGPFEIKPKFYANTQE